MSMTHTTPALPPGAVDACHFENGSRVVFGPEYGVEDIATVRPTATQLASGAVADDPAVEAPHVNLWMGSGEGARMTPARARQLARLLIGAADMADLWLLDDAIERHPAGSQL
jgi:hypothetical protein